MGWIRRINSEEIEVEIAEVEINEDSIIVKQRYGTQRKLIAPKL